jgi:hypothetical protein
MIPFSSMKYKELRESRSREEKGSALLLVLLALSILALLGLFMTIEATTGLYISDNYESRVQATYAAMAGLNHARALMRGLENDAFLKGLDGAYNPDFSYLEQAKKFSFRNPFPLVTAHSLDISDPDPDVSGIPDDGLINTGFHDGVPGTPLIPITGIAQKAPDPDGSGEIVTSRYFVKVADNNGEASELAGDSTDNPFIDGDGEVIVRSIGIAKTFSDVTGSVWRRNSAVVFEARYRKFSVFDFGPALLVLGSRILPSLDGTYGIDGGLFPGIGVIDTDVADFASPGQIIGMGPFGSGNISGAGLPDPSIQDITGPAESDPERSRILNPQYLWDFVFNEAPQLSDGYFNSDQSWDSWTVPDIGFYDPEKPFNAPGQNPKLTVVHGDLRMTGNLTGGGLLIVTGDFECVDACQYDGLVLVIGSGRMFIDTSGKGITGGLIIADIGVDKGIPGFGNPEFTIRGSSRIRSDENAVKAALGLIPPIQTSFREIAGTDP